MSASESTVIDGDQGPTDAVSSVSIENMLNMRAAAVERYLEVLRLLKDADDIARAAHLGEVCFEIHSNTGGHRCRAPHANAANLIRQTIDRGAWKYLMSESGLRTFMDATARKTWDQQLCETEVPELTRANVTATFQTLHETREDMFDRGVIACFKSLSWDYKTNQPFKFGKRIILHDLFSVYKHGTSRSMYLRHETCDKLDDLIRVFSVVDGKPEPDHRQGMCTEIDRAHTARKNEWEGDYFHVRWYLKGSAHLTFRRVDLVDRLNGILAKHFPRALDAPRA